MKSDNRHTCSTVGSGQSFVSEVICGHCGFFFVAVVLHVLGKKSSVKCYTVTTVKPA